MKKKYLISIILLLSTVLACRKERPQAVAPLNFATEQTKAGLSTVFENFKVWGSSVWGSSSSVMEGYKVYFDAATGWTYTEVPGTEGQELQYWNYSAQEFRFHAGAPLERVKRIRESSIEMEILSTQVLSETSLYSAPYVVSRKDPAYGELVNLSFRYANARVNVAFRCVSDSQVRIEDVKLLPPSALADRADMSIGYDWVRVAADAKLSSVASRALPELAFPDMQIAGDAQSFSESSLAWYMVPDPVSKGQWRLSARVDGVDKIIRFTVSKPWEAGKSYLYRFEYTDKANLVFVGTSELFIGEDPVDGGEHNFS